MKKILLLTILILPFFSNAQAHIGMKITDIQKLYPNQEFEMYDAKDGTKCMKTEMVYGTFGYMFDKETRLCYLCYQLPSNIANLNAQVEIYNKSYVIISDRKWKAYLEDGTIMYIKLDFSEEEKLYCFIYTSVFN